MTYTTDKTAKSKSAFCINNLKANDVSKTAHISTVNLSHHLIGKVIVKNDVKVQQPLADMLQPSTANGQHVNDVNICQHPHSVVMPFTPMGNIESINNLQRFTPVMDISKRILISQRYETIDQSLHPQFEDMLKDLTCFDIGISRNQTITFDNRLKGVKTYYFGEYQVDKKLTFTNSLLRNFRSTSRARSCIETHLKDKKVIAKGRSNNYANHALSKISKLALVGYEYTSVYSPLRAFFMRNISMRSHLYGEAGEGHFRVCWFLVFQSTNPFQLCHPHLVVNGKAPNTHGVHTHV